MSTTGDAPTSLADGPPLGPGGDSSQAPTLAGDIRFVLSGELYKLRHQLTPRLLIGGAVLGPILFIVLVRFAGATPGDTLLGADVHSSGFASPLVLLAFTASFGFPFSAAFLAGDIFAAEDRHNTWKNVLTRAVDRRAVFIAKFLAAGLWAVGLLLLIAVVSLAAGVLIVGAQPLVGLSGQLIAAGPAFGLTLVAWLLCIPPLLGFVSLGVLFSVATRSGIAGVIAPILLALVMQLLARVGQGGLGHQLLLLAAFDAWHGLFTRPLLGLPLVGIAVSLVWSALALSVAWILFARRDFAGAGSPAARSSTALGLSGGLALLLAAMVAVCFLGHTVAAPAQVQTTLDRAFNRVSSYQAELLHRPVLAASELHDSALCARSGGAPRGAGDDWGCRINVLVTAAPSATPDYEPVEYELSIKTNGCFAATGMPYDIGTQTLHTAAGQPVHNPLFEFYACFNPL